MTIIKAIKLLLEARNFNAPIKFIDKDGKEHEVKSVYIDKTGAVFEGETE